MAVVLSPQGWWEDAVLHPLGLQEASGREKAAGGCSGARLLWALPTVAHAGCFTPSPVSVHESFWAPSWGQDVCQIPSAPFCSPL